MAQVDLDAEIRKRKEKILALNNEIKAIKATIAIINGEAEVEPENQQEGDQEDA